MTLSLELWLPPLFVGLALLVLAALWRTLARGGRRRRTGALLHDALVDPDPRVRLAAVQVAVQRGIAPVAGELLRATRTERDPTVLEGITDAVARHQWEPTLEPELLELRLWAQRRLGDDRQEQRDRHAPVNGVVQLRPQPPPQPPAPALPDVIDWLLTNDATSARARRRR